MGGGSRRGIYLWPDNEKAEFPTSKIGRANLDGSNVNQRLITVSGEVIGVATDGTHVYWANQTRGMIGRANLDGGEVEPSFIKLHYSTLGVAVDSGHIYWIRDYPEEGGVGRASIDGGDIEEEFITGAHEPDGLAVDAGHVYWSNYGDNTIGRANLSGGETDEQFIGNAQDPFGVAVDAEHVYWADPELSAIGRANLDGTETDQGFITGIKEPTDVAVDGLRPSAQCTTASGTIKLSPGLTNTASVQTMKIKGTMSGCTGESFAEVRYSATLKTAAPVSCAVLQAGEMATGPAKLKWAPVGKPAYATLNMMLSEAPGSAFAGEIVSAAFTPLRTFVGSDSENYTGGSACGVPVGEKAAKAVKTGTFTASTTRFE